jgi:hypothetical protein
LWGKVLVKVFALVKELDVELVLLLAAYLGTWWE